MIKKKKSSLVVISTAFITLLLTEKMSYSSRIYILEVEKQHQSKYVCVCKD